MARTSAISASILSTDVANTQHYSPAIADSMLKELRCRSLSMLLGLPARGSGDGGGKRTRLLQVGIDRRMRGGVLTDLEQFLASAKWKCGFLA